MFVSLPKALVARSHERLNSHIMFCMPRSHTTSISLAQHNIKLWRAWCSLLRTRRRSCERLAYKTKCVNKIESAAFEALLFVPFSPVRLRFKDFVSRQPARVFKTFCKPININETHLNFYDLRKSTSMLKCCTESAEKIEL